MAERRTAVVAITENMVKAGLDILEKLTAEGTPEEDATDAQLVIAIFTRMWQTKMKEEEAIRHGKNPPAKVIPIRSKLILPREVN